jgi:hypothetical protein
MRASGLFRIPVTMATLIAMATLILPTVFLISSATPARAAEPTPGFTISSHAEPANFSASDTELCLERVGTSLAPCDSYVVTVTNAGATTTDGTPITISDSLPAGVLAQSIELRLSVGEGKNEGATLCTAVPLECMLPEALAPDERATMVITVTTEPGASGLLLNRATVFGGGASTVQTPEGPAFENPVSSAPPAFGASQFEFFISGVDGRTDAQAGDHPYELTTTIGLRTAIRQTQDFGFPLSVSPQDLKDVLVDLPLGFVGSTLAAPQCTLAQLSSQLECPKDTQVGRIETSPLHSTDGATSPIWNMVPERGAPAEFGYRDTLKGAHVFYAHVVPSVHGYVLRTSALDIPQISLKQIIVTFFGDPAAKDQSGNAEVPFFTNPTSCSREPPRAVLHMDSWQHPARFGADGEPDLTDPNWSESAAESPPVTGCNGLAFGPSLSVQPTTFQADTPSGLNFELGQLQSETVGSLATATLKKAVIKFPLGMTVNPSAADGLQACSEAQIGWVGPSPSAFSSAAQQCPEASKIGTLELTTPLIPHQLTGAMYLAAQNANPFGSTIGAYVVVDDPITGVLVKIAGKLLLDPDTGQMTGIFDENPNLPFSDLKLNFFGGPRAEFATPESCGTFTTSSELTPWSAPDSGPPAIPFDSFPVNSGCVSAFNPSFTALSTNLQAGAFTPFVASFSRGDADQELAGATVSLPPGLLANVGSVPECPEAQANAGTCPESTRVGTITAGAGPGPNPLFVTGRVYWTGPYKGGAFGLSIVVPTVAGPFDFGNVVVRASLRIDPSDAHATVVSDAFPTILRPTGADGQTVGIPIKLRRVDVSIDRPGFTFNPTNCSKLQVGGSLSSTQGLSSTLATPFQVTNCAGLKFAPKFSVSTSGKTSKANGASLTATVSEPPNSMGTQANISFVKVELPKALPSRLTTLQKACLAAVFNANPANCPSASIIGHAKVITALLPVPLEGPAIFVSHGGEAFPSLTMVLQGDNVTIDLVGTTFIDKHGITSTTFKTVPDTPFNTFSLTLPEGPYSALAANGSLCSQTLKMPNEFKGQNGLEVHQSTTIAVTGCKPAITVTKHTVKGHTATLQVNVPSAGKLVATANGLSKGTGKTTKAQNVTVKLTLSKSQAAFLQKHKGRKLKATIHLSFTPKHGAKLKAITTVLIG